MKRIIIKILIYSIIVLIVLCIASIPRKIDQEKLEAVMQYEANKVREISEEHWPDMPEDMREDSIKGTVNIIRDSYEYSNSFKHKFLRNLRLFFIGLPIAIVGGILHWLHSRELWGK